MGCDIHTFIEYRKSTSKGPVWTSGDDYELNEYFGMYKDEPEFIKINEVCGNRNYELFATLANVRNCDIKPLFEPKGIPSNSCKFILEEYKSWGSNVHSASYFTLAELVHALPKCPILQYLVDELLERYKKLLPQNAPLVTYNDLRFVFWFDN